MKKIFAVLLALTVMLTLAACGSGSGETTTAASGLTGSGDEGVVVFVTDTDGNTLLDEQGNPVTEVAIQLVTGDVDQGWY